MKFFDEPWLEIVKLNANEISTNMITESSEKDYDSANPTPGDDEDPV